MLLFLAGDYKLDRYGGNTWEKQKEKTRRIMIRDIERSIEKAREEVEQGAEPFGFEDLVNSAKKTIWVGERELREMCVEALFNLLDPRDYRKNDIEIFKQDLFPPLKRRNSNEN